MTSNVLTLKNGTNIYNREAFLGLQESCNKLKEIRTEVIKNVVPGATTRELNKLAEELIRKSNSDTLFKGYDNFPYTTCLSNNEQIVHGVPTDDLLKEGDVLTVDIGLKYKGYCADSARTVTVGKDLYNNQELIDTAKKAFYAGLEKALIGNTTGDIGFAIHKTILLPQIIPGNWASGYKYKIFVEFCGHGIGLSLHEPPSFPNYGSRGKGLKLLEGMCFCIEPVVLYSSSKVVKSHIDGIIRFSTEDLKPSAQHENQIYLSDDGPIVLT